MVGRLMCVQAMRKVYKAALCVDISMLPKRAALVPTDNTAGHHVDDRSVKLRVRVNCCL